MAGLVFLKDRVIGPAMRGVLLIAGILLAGCSSGGTGGTSSGTYAAKCEVGCRPPSMGDCSTQDPTQCQKDCTALTEGLTVDCATCVAEHVTWSGNTLTTCEGYSIPLTSGAECAALCSPANRG